jgi:hypothetical protein
MLRFVITAILLVGAAAACKSGGGQDSVSQAPVTDDEFRWMAAQAVNAALLTDNDLPAGFNPVPADGDDEDDDDPPLELTGECAEFNDILNLDGNFLAAVAEAETGDFENAAEDSISSNAGAFREAAAAEAEATKYQRFIGTSACVDQLKAATRALADELAAAEGLTVVTLEIEMKEIPVPTQGDWAHGTRTSMNLAFSDGRGVDYVLDSLSIRDGRMIGTVVYSYSGEPDVALRDALVATVAARLAAEDEKLPG